MKVLHCIPGFGGGGGERQLAYLAGPLAARGWEVHIAAAFSGPNLARLEKAGATVHWLEASNAHDPRLLWQLAGVVRRLKPDVMHAWFTQMDVLGGLTAEFFGLPWVLSERSSSEAYAAGLKNRLRVCMARRADAIVANSTAGIAYWNDRVSSRIPRLVIANAVPFDEIDATAPAVPPGMDVREGDALVLFAGRFAVEKGLDELVEALSTIVQRPRTKAVLCGDGPLRAAVIDRIASWGLQDRILVPGYVENLWRLMKRADVVVSVSHFEGHPNIVIEAMAAMRPLVVSDIRAHRAMLDEGSAFWTRTVDAPGIAAAVIEALSRPDEASRRGRAARSRALGWSVDAAALAYDGVYRRLVLR